MTAANEGAPLSRAKRINVTGTAQVRGLPFGIGRGLDREESVVRAHARRHAFGGFDRHREGSALRVGVVRDHRRKLHAVAGFFRNAHAHDPRAVANHLRHLFFGEAFGAENEVALVFTVFVVHHAEAFPARKALEGLFHAFDRIASEIFERQFGLFHRCPSEIKKTCIVRNFLRSSLRFECFLVTKRNLYVLPCVPTKTRPRMNRRTEPVDSIRR